MPTERKKAFLVPLTEDEERLLNAKRRSEGLTLQGLFRKLVLKYLQGEAND